jgi:tRNA(Arg) A34 adenosine deaminase TadA
MTTAADLAPADLTHLRHAIALAQSARDSGKHPFAALVVGADGKVIAEAGNNSLPPDGDPTQHAELRAAQLAARAAGDTAKLAGATLYTSAEPCAMCAGAIYWCGIGRVVYALSEHRLLELTGDHPENPTFSLPCREVFARGQRRIEVVGPVLEDEAAAAHAGFWSKA